MLRLLAVLAVLAVLTMPAVPTLLEAPALLEVSALSEARVVAPAPPLSWISSRVAMCGRAQSTGAHHLDPQLAPCK